MTSIVKLCLPDVPARIVMLPFGVNFRALLSRFTTICFTFCRSLRIAGTSDATFVSTFRPDFAMIGSSSEQTFISRSVACQ